jgi:hypothetical protein
MTEFYILTRDPQFANVLEFIRKHELVCEVHLNRTRFLVPYGSLYTEFALRYGHCCHIVDSHADLITGW